MEKVFRNFFLNTFIFFLNNNFKYVTIFKNRTIVRMIRGDNMSYVIQENMSIERKLEILSDAAKYDVACTSSGVDRAGKKGSIGNTAKCGICHSFSADGRCISLLKILLTNECIFDCKYCLNRASNDNVRATFTPDEICKLTIEFYRRNYIEGLFLSSGILVSPDYTMGLLYETIYLLRTQYKFNGYIHVKGIPGASSELIERMGYLTDRMSVNLELPTGESLKKLAPHKNRANMLKPITQIRNGITDNKEKKNELVAMKKMHLSRNVSVPNFVPAGQSTQMIIGATPESDYQIITVAESLYNKYDMRRVFYSAYVPINEDKDLPALDVKPPLLREHRLYQADWLLRFYGFKANELLDEKKPDFNTLIDPKCDWAVRHLDKFPVEINRADYYTLLRVPGIGVKSARRIVSARRYGRIDFEHLKKMGVVLKRAVFFITCNGRMMYDIKLEENYILNNLISDEIRNIDKVSGDNYHQMSIFEYMKQGVG